MGKHSVDLRSVGCLVVKYLQFKTFRMHVGSVGPLVWFLVFFLWCLSLCQ